MLCASKRRLGVRSCLTAHSNFYYMVDFAPPAKALRDPTQKCQPYLEAVTKYESNINGVGPRKWKRTTLRRDLGVPRAEDACKRRAIASLASGAPVSDAAFAHKREGEIEVAMLQDPVERAATQRNGAFSAVAAAARSEAMVATISVQQTVARRKL